MVNKVSNSSSPIPGNSLPTIVEVPEGLEMHCCDASPINDQLNDIAKRGIENLPTPEQRRFASEIATIIELATESDDGAATAVRDFRGIAGDIATSLRENLQSMSRARGRALTFEERHIGAIAFLARVLRNDFESAPARWAANFANVGLRTGISTAIMTSTRQVLAASLRFAEVNRQIDPASMAVIGNLALLLGPALNLAGAAMDEHKNIATAQSRIGRAAMLTSSLAASALANYASVETQIAASAVAIAEYTGGRDVVHALFPLRDNAGGIKLAATTKAAALFAGAQYASGQAMDHYAPNSGAGAIKAPGLPFPNTLSDDVTRGVINGSVEIADAIANGYFSRNQEIANNRARIPADQLTRAQVEGLRISLELPFLGRTVRQQCEAMRDQFLTTNAMRTSAFETVNAVVTATNELMGNSLDDRVRGSVLNGLAAGMIGLIYPAFAFAHAKKSS